jgi:catechol 2,3-dioxygenase-like lactoylglutathione lyase family enzyme
MTVHRVLHPIAMVASLDRAVAFYGEALGFEVTQRWRHDPDRLAALTGYDEPQAEAAILAAPDGTEIELVQFDRPQSATPRRRLHDIGLSMISLGVSDLDATMQRIAASGGAISGHAVTFGAPPATSRVVYGSDPDGITLCLVEAGTR